LKFRSELAEVFTHGDYQPIEVNGPHRDHIIAFARSRGRDAGITIAAKSFAPFTQAGRIWPRAENIAGTINLRGFSLQGVDAGAAEIPLSSLCKYLPVAVLHARRETSAKRIRQRSHA
jgi:(1->4)-alpha-D-glucan 1-alpha-D-glucosylmutase